MWKEATVVLRKVLTTDTVLHCEKKCMCAVYSVIQKHCWQYLRFTHKLYCCMAKTRYDATPLLAVTYIRAHCSWQHCNTSETSTYIWWRRYIMDRLICALVSLYETQRGILSFIFIIQLEVSEMLQWQKLHKWIHFGQWGPIMFMYHLKV